MVHRVAVVAAGLLLSSCSASAPSKPAPEPSQAAQKSAPAAEAAPPVGSANPVEAVPLEVVLTDQTTTGRVMKMRGKIVNPHAEPVDGVRLQLVFLAPTGEGDGAKVLEIQQKEVNSNLEPGGSTALRWDVESLYLGSHGRFMVVAYPAKLGDQEMPPPDHWNE